MVATWRSRKYPGVSLPSLMIILLGWCGSKQRESPRSLKTYKEMRRWCYHPTKNMENKKKKSFIKELRTQLHTVRKRASSPSKCTRRNIYSLKLLLKLNCIHIMQNKAAFPGILSCLPLKVAVWHYRWGRPPQSAPFVHYWLLNTLVFFFGGLRWVDRAAIYAVSVMTQQRERVHGLHGKVFFSVCAQVSHSCQESTF